MSGALRRHVVCDLCLIGDFPCIHGDSTQSLHKPRDWQRGGSVRAGYSASFASELLRVCGTSCLRFIARAARTLRNASRVAARAVVLPPRCWRLRRLLSVALLTSEVLRARRRVQESAVPSSILHAPSLLISLLLMHPRCSAVQTELHLLTRITQHEHRLHACSANASDCSEPFCTLLSRANQAAITSHGSYSTSIAFMHAQHEAASVCSGLLPSRPNDAVTSSHGSRSTSIAFVHALLKPLTALSFTAR